MTDKIQKDDPRLTAYVLGELDAAENAEIENAISSSPELASSVDEIRAAVKLLGEAYQTELPLSLLDEQKSELEKAGTVGLVEVGSSEFKGGGVVPKSAQTDTKSSRSGRPWLPLVLAASLLGLLVGGAFYFSDPPIDGEVASKIERVNGMNNDEIEAVAERAKMAAGGEIESPEDLYKPIGKAVDSRLNLRGGSELLKSENDLKVNEFEPAQAPPAFAADSDHDDMMVEPGDGGAGFGGVDEEVETGEGESGEGQKGESSSGQGEPMPANSAGFGGRGGGRVGDDRKPQEWHRLQQGRLHSDGAPEGGVNSAESQPRTKRPIVMKPSAPPAFAPGLMPAEGTHDRRPEVMLDHPVGEQKESDLVRGIAQLDDGKNKEALVEGELEGLLKDASEMSQRVLLSEEDQKKMIRRKFSEIELAENESAESDLPKDQNIQIESTSGDALDGQPKMDLIDKALAENGDDGKREAEKTENAKVADRGAVPMASADGPVGGGVISGGAVGSVPAYGGVPGGMGAGAAASGMSGGAISGQPEVNSVIESANARLAESKSRKEQELQQRYAAYRNEALQQAEELGLKAETKKVIVASSLAVPVTRMRTESKTRNVPVTKMRTEKRKRIVNGKEEEHEVQIPYTEQVTQNYTVSVPYTENVTQTYQVEVPQVVLDLPEANADKLIEDLVLQFDPNGKQEFELEALLAKSLENQNQTKQETKKLAKVLYDNIKAKADRQADLKFDASGVFEKLKKSLERRNEKVRKTKTWKRVKANPNTSRLMVGDKDELDLTGMQVNVQVDGFRARVLIDCFYYNNRASQLEGNFKLRLPDDASLYYFAFGESAYNLQPKGKLAEQEFLDDGTQFVSLRADDVRKARKDAWRNVKEARMVPREKAAHAYRETVRRKIDPALVEWSGAGVFNARVFPLAPNKLHRIVIGYDVNLTKVDDGWAYQLDLPEQAGQCQVEMNLQLVDGVEYNIEPACDPTPNEINGITHRRYRFFGNQENGIRLSANKSPEILLHSSDDEEGEFWGIQVKPDLPVEELKGNSSAIFMLDTSLSSNPDKFNVWLKMLRSTLENNRDTLKNFNVMFFNVDGHFWKDGYVANTSENVDELMAKCDTLALEGATDIYGAIQSVAETKWVSEPESVGDKARKPDLFLLSDGAATWGETNLRLIARQFEDNNLGSMFAYQTGLTGTAISNLRFLAGETGGAVFSVATEDEIKTASTAHRKRPWKFNTVTAEGATDTMTAGRVQWVYPGQSITIVGRGNVDGAIELNLEQSGNEKTITISPEKIVRVESELASRLYGQIAVGQLESLGAKVFDVAASYARHFRVTGDTCSLLMLETEQDYERFGIKPEEDLFVIKSKVAKDHVADVLRKSADQLADPKSQLLAWLDRLESMPGMSFKMPTALKLAMDDIQVDAISKPLDCVLTEKPNVNDDYLEALVSEKLDYAKIAAEANRRGGTSIDEAIKVYSSLVERNPGDIVIARDVAFTAMELDRPAQAYHLLRSVAKARPFQGSVYPALGQCLTQLGKADMAIVYYEVALGGTFQRQGVNFKEIVSTEYMHLLRKIVSGKLDSSVKDFAKARLATFSKSTKFTSADVVITMMWNTDQTDVDLHVVEPSGEECSYENKRTRSNGQITDDITTGFGPEMYFNANAPAGKYDIQVKYFGNGQNRTELRNKVHLTIYRGFGTDEEKVDRRTVELKNVGNKESVATIGVE